MVYEIEFKEKGLAFAAYKWVRAHYKVRGLYYSGVMIEGRIITLPDSDLDTIEDLLKKHKGRFKVRD